MAAVVLRVARRRNRPTVLTVGGVEDKNYPAGRVGIPFSLRILVERCCADALQVWLVWRNCSLLLWR